MRDGYVQMREHADDGSSGVDYRDNNVNSTMIQPEMIRRRNTYFEVPTIRLLRADIWYTIDYKSPQDAAWWLYKHHDHNDRT